MSKFKKLTDFLKSLKCRLILLCILIGIVPSVLLRAGMLGSYENRAVSIRTSEILSQAKILANQIVSNDYLNNAEEIVGVMKKAVFTEDASYTLQSVYNNAPQ